MQFISLQFGIFLSISLFLYYFLPAKFQKIVILIASLIFYISASAVSNTIYLLYLLTIYFLLIKKMRKGLIVALLLLPLAIVKYGQQYTPGFNPLGISFISFMAISYIFEFFRNNKRIIGLKTFLSYVLFFPHVTSGPIDKPNSFIDQWKRVKKIQLSFIFRGLELIIIGVFQKFVISNQLKLYVDAVYKNPEYYSGIPILFGIIFFSFQLYCDFMGYTNIVTGIAKFFGIDLALNFNKPYLSTSITEFWKRWHISLSTWLKENIYFTLGGNRINIRRTYLNILIVFTISGFWHGDTLLFVLWGILHGLFIILGKLVQKHFKNKHLYTVKIILTFFTVSFLWILFRASSFHQAIEVFSLAVLPQAYSSGLDKVLTNQDILFSFETSLILILVLMMSESINEKSKFNFKMQNNMIYKTIFLTCLLLSILFLGVFKDQNFYYVRF